jgi:cytochrome oxidase Cu insertion factor (SCO1/SenC/PrrC family)
MPCNDKVLAGNRGPFQNRRSTFQLQLFFPVVHVDEETHRLGIENFLTFAGRDDEAEGGYAHSGSFTLVDKAGHVRGVYAVTNMDLSVNAKEYKRLKTDLINLLNYEYHVK